MAEDLSPQEERNVLISQIKKYRWESGLVVTQGCMGKASNYATRAN